MGWCCSSRGDPAGNVPWRAGVCGLSTHWWYAAGLWPDYKAGTRITGDFSAWAHASQWAWSGYDKICRWWSRYSAIDQYCWIGNWYPVGQYDDYSPRRYVWPVAALPASWPCWAGSPARLCLFNIWSATTVKPAGAPPSWGYANAWYAWCRIYACILWYGYSWCRKSAWWRTIRPCSWSWGRALSRDVATSCWCRQIWAWRRKWRWCKTGMDTANQSWAGNPFAWILCARSNRAAVTLSPDCRSCWSTGNRYIDCRTCWPFWRFARSG